MLKKCDYCNQHYRPSQKKLHLRRCAYYRRALKAGKIKSPVKITQLKEPPEIFGVGQEIPMQDKSMVNIKTVDKAKGGKYKNEKKSK